MPTLRKLRDDLSAAAVRMGADLVRVGPLTADLETVPGYTLQKELPGYKEYTQRVRYRLLPWIF